MCLFYPRGRLGGKTFLGWVAVKAADGEDTRKQIKKNKEPGTRQPTRGLKVTTLKKKENFAATADRRRVAGHRYLRVLQPPPPPSLQLLKSRQGHVKWGIRYTPTGMARSCCWPPSQGAASYMYKRDLTWRADPQKCQFLG